MDVYVCVYEPKARKRTLVKAQILLELEELAQERANMGKETQKQERNRRGEGEKSKKALQMCNRICIQEHSQCLSLDLLRLSKVLDELKQKPALTQEPMDEKGNIGRKARKRYRAHISSEWRQGNHSNRARLCVHCVRTACGKNTKMVFVSQTE